MSGSSWRLTAFGSRAAVGAALEAQEQLADWPQDVVLSASEAAEDRPDDWRLDAYFMHEPASDDQSLLSGLFGGTAPPLQIEQLTAADWVKESQRGLEPVRVGRFLVRTPEYRSYAGHDVEELIIPAAQAFGTGQHATTGGCLGMLDSMEQSGFQPRNIIDVGTGTGLLAFAALHLWPEARITASDSDPVCREVLRENAALNKVALGPNSGQVEVVIAPGLDHPLLASRAPYDLLIANILAEPLVELAHRFAQHLASEGSIILSGLLASQQEQVVSAYEEADLRFAQASIVDDWAILRLWKPASPIGD